MGDDPRTLWRPVYARVYGLRPWDMHRVRLSEMEAMGADLKALSDR